MPTSKFDTFEALNGVKNMSICKTQETYKGVKMDHHAGVHHVSHHNRLERWVTNATIGLFCGFCSFLLKMVVQFLAGVREDMISSESADAVGLGFVFGAWLSVLVFSCALLFVR